MGQSPFAVALLDDHKSAEASIRRLGMAEFDMQSLSVVGKGFLSGGAVVGFYSFVDRVCFWGSRGAFRGGLWSLFFGGLFLTVPMIGGGIVLGYFATVVLTALESALDVAAVPQAAH